MESMVARPEHNRPRPFVGRARELEVATTMLADTDRAGVILIGGESGLGKTRLVEEIVASAPTTATVVRGVAVPRQTPIPFELIRSAVGWAERGQSERRDTDLETSGATAEIAHHVFSATHPDGGQWSLADRILASAEMLRSMHDQSTIFVFEDVHWADAESLEVIDRLLVTGPLGASVLITYRPNALRPGHLTSNFLQRAERRSHVAQLRLEPLRREEVADFLARAGRDADDKTVEHVHSRTGGNPLLLSELVAATDSDADLTSGLPWTLAEMLRPEIDRLSATERTVAEAVAVLGVDVGFEYLAAAVAASEDELLGGLRSLVDLGILVESGPDQFGFRHDLVREAVADSLFTREHRRIHGAVHDALLEAGSDDVVALVAHATGAGRSKQAADAARDGAFAAFDSGRSHQSLALAEQALLVHTDDLGLLRVAVVAGWLTGQGRAALDHLERWGELVGLEPSARAEVLHHRVRLHWEIGDAERAERAAEELSSVAEKLPHSATLAQALADLAQHYMLSGQVERAIATADRALDVADDVGPSAVAAARQARAERASARLWSGDELEAAVSELLAVADEAEEAGDLVVASRALHNTPIDLPVLDARLHVERMRRTSQRAGFACATDGYRLGLLRLAETDGVREVYVNLLEAAMEELPDSLLVLVQALLSVIDDGRAEQAGQIAQKLELLSNQSSHFRTRGKAALAMLQLESGDIDGASRWFEGAVGDDFELDIVLRFLTPILGAGLEPQLKGFLARRTTGSEAEASCPIAEPAFKGIEAEFLDGPEIAESLYAEALGSGIRRSAVNEAEIHLARARMARAMGSDERPHLEAAGRRLAQWPGRRREFVESLLGESCCDDKPVLLTPREREVANLVARGLTNGGIADELFISTKTASVHVSNILAKLTMTSRAEIAAWVASGGLG